jgi:alpha-tubulin suppressor-like RCC1 family protein
MASNFKSNGTDLDDIFAPRTWFQGGGSLWAWGYGGDGSLGLNNTQNLSSPVQVGNYLDWKEISAGSSHSLSIKNDGTLWAWGGNSGNFQSGVLGINSVVNQSSPTQVGILTNWKQVNAGAYNSFSVKNDGTLWTWGRGAVSIFGGLLGLNDNSLRSSPVQIGISTDWKEVSVRSLHTHVIKDNGSLWSWGVNTDGRLGLNDTISRSSPTQVGSLTDWKQVSAGGFHTNAIKPDGTLWGWGLGSAGRHGHNDVVSRSSPTQVGSLTDWKQVSVGRDHSIAVKNTGTLWAWGLGSDGRLGLNDIANRSSPTQIGSLTDWKQVSAGGFSLAIKTNGTLWSWGGNYFGYLGLNNIIYASSPVQVGSFSNWRNVSAGLFSHSLAVKKDGPLSL